MHLLHGCIQIKDAFSFAFVSCLPVGLCKSRQLENAGHSPISQPLSPSLRACLHTCVPVALSVALLGAYGTFAVCSGHGHLPPLSINSVQTSEDGACIMLLLTSTTKRRQLPYSNQDGQLCAQGQGMHIREVGAPNPHNTHTTPGS